LDSGVGACYLRDERVAQVVADALKYFNEERYVLREWVIMPNHVHVLFRPLANQSVSEITKSWKQFTSVNAKKILELGDKRFWQPESYDHWVRNDGEKAKIARYIRNNPVRAKLCATPEEWKWSSAWPENS
jgi:REP element-mobilizing transposase RayT